LVAIPGRDCRPRRQRPAEGRRGSPERALLQPIPLRVPQPRAV